jgi:DNA-binding beta-propeller fold protein YncE
VEASSGTKIWEVTGFDAPESVVLDPGSTAIYVSNVAGSVMATDGNGFISKVSPDGKMIERNWVTGLNGPTGLAISDGKLYVADIDELVEIDILGAKIRKRYPAVGARFLNDVASDGAGAVYTSDMMTDTIWRLKDGKFAAWLKSPDLNGPNGLLVDGDKLVVAAFGRLSGNDKVAEAGTLLFVSLADKSIKPLRGGAIGNLDGLLMLAPGRYVATDWPKGALYLITSDGKSEEIIDLNQGTADIALGADKNTVLIPMMKDNAVVAYRIE